MYQLFRTILFLSAITIGIHAMDIVPLPKTITEEKKEWKLTDDTQFKLCGKVDETGTRESITLPWKQLQASSVIKAYVTDHLPDFEVEHIPPMLIEDFCPGKDFFCTEVAKIFSDNDIGKLTPQDNIIELANLADLLGFSDETTLPYLGNRIVQLYSDYKKQYCDSAAFQQLIPTFAQKYVVPHLMEPVIDYVKTMILQQRGNNNNRKKFFEVNDITAMTKGGFFNNDTCAIVWATDFLGVVNLDNGNKEKILSDRYWAYSGALTMYKNNFIASHTTVWNMSTMPNKKIYISNIAKNTDNIDTLSFSMDGKYLVGSVNPETFQNNRSTIYAWDIGSIDWCSLNTPEFARETCKEWDISNNLDYVFGVSFVSNNQFLAVGQKDKKIKIVCIDVIDSSFEIKNELYVADGFNDPRNIHIAFSHDGNKICFRYGALKEGKTKMIFFDIKNNHMFEWEPYAPPFCVSFSADDAWVICGFGAQDSTIVIYDAADGKTIHSLDALYTNWFVTVSSDGKKLLVGGAGATAPLDYYWYPDPRNMGIYTLRTDHEDTVLKKITTLPIDQALSIVKLRGTELQNMMTHMLAITPEALVSFDAHAHNIPHNSGIVKKTWDQWFNRASRLSWQQFFGAAAIGAAGAYGLYKYYKSQPK